MRRTMRELFEPWRTTPGWEFDLLRTLPPNTATLIYQRAWRAARPRLLWRWQSWVIVSAMMMVLMASMVLIWAAAAVLGLGPVGRIVLEFVFHLTVGLLVLHPLIRLQQRQALPFVRAALADELLWLAEDELTPRRRRPRLPTRRLTPPGSP